MYIYIYIYICSLGTYLSIYRAGLLTTYMFTVSFHNFKSQDFKLSVSNPKNKYVVYSSVLSPISNCQGLGRKNKHEILKTDRRLVRDLSVYLSRRLADDLSIYLLIAKGSLRTCVFITGGCSGRGVRWMGVVLYNKLLYNII